MIVEDPIYGRNAIKDELIKSLINCAEFQRLKRLNCNGVPDKYYYFNGFSRYDHSLGVYFLLVRFGASYKEQVAGLLHDISHKAFSHVYDWVINDPTVKGDQEDAQDRFHMNMANSEAGRIIERFNINPLEIFDLGSYSLLDREIPELCADRIDYSIRSIPVRTARRILNNLTVDRGVIVCASYGIADEFGRAFLDLQNNFWGQAEAVSTYYHFSEILKKALKMGVITPEDFDTDDEAVIDIIQASNNKELVNSLNILESKIFVNQNDTKNQKTVFKKFRYIDPQFVDKGEVRVLSHVSKSFKQKLAKSMDKSNQGVSFTPLW